MRIACRLPTVHGLGPDDVATVERCDFQAVERIDDHLRERVEPDVVDEQPKQVADRDRALVRSVELTEDGVRLLELVLFFEQFFVGRTHVAGAGRADRDDVVKAEGLRLRVGARIEYARHVAVDVVEHRSSAARSCREFDQFDAEFVGQEQCRIEELRTGLFGDAAREEAVTLCFRGFRATLLDGGGERDGHYATGTSMALKIVRISSTLSTGCMMSGGILPFAAMRRPSGMILISPRTLKRPTVPTMTSFSASIPVCLIVFATTSAWRGPGASVRPIATERRFVSMMRSCGSTCFGQ